MHVLLAHHNMMLAAFGSLFVQLMLSASSLCICHSCIQLLMLQCNRDKAILTAKIYVSLATAAAAGHCALLHYVCSWPQRCSGCCCKVLGLQFLPAYLCGVVCDVCNLSDRWLLNLDGWTAAYRFAQLLAVNSLVLKQESPELEFYYRWGWSSWQFC